jgi:hypothetical protein
MATNASCTIAELPPLAQLRVLDVYTVDDLATVLAQATNLRWLSLAKADGMVRSSTHNVRHGPTATWSSKLQVITIGACDELGEEKRSHLLQLICKMDVPQLRTLRLWNWPCAELPNTILQARALLRLDLTNSSSLLQLPQELGNLVNIRWLTLHGCSSLQELPDSTTDLRLLKWLDLKDCSSLKLLPNSLGKLQHLESVNLSNCRSLQALPDSITQCPLRAVMIRGCSSIHCLPAGFDDLPLEYFSYTNLKADIPPEWIAHWRSLGKCCQQLWMSTVHMHGAASGHCNAWHALHLCCQHSMV